MLSRLRRLLGKGNGKPKDSRERQKKGGFLPQCKRSGEKWHSEFWVRDGEVTGENGLEMGLPRVGLRCEGVSEMHGSIRLAGHVLMTLCFHSEWEGFTKD